MGILDKSSLTLGDNRNVYLSQFVIYMPSFFFFSSRRRHTRFDCDWSSDVCSSDLIYAMGLSYLPDRQTEPLALARGGVRVSAIDKAMYEEAVTAVGAHAQGDYIWAGPDCPEVYFLAAKRNPTRTLFDFFDEPARRTGRVLDAIERHDVRVGVFNRRPPLSGGPPSDLVEALVERFPRTLDARWLHVRWRE